MKDTPLLHFLKNFPPWIVLTALAVTFVFLYKITGDVNYKEWVSLILASLFTALGVRAQQPQQTGSTTSGDIIQVSPDETKLPDEETEKQPDSNQ